MSPFAALCSGLVLVWVWVGVPCMKATRAQLHRRELYVAARAQLGVHVVAFDYRGMRGCASAANPLTVL